jgi:hypothetical protein
MTEKDLNKLQLQALGIELLELGLRVRRAWAESRHLVWGNFDGLPTRGMLRSRNIWKFSNDLKDGLVTQHDCRWQLIIKKYGE